MGKIEPIRDPGKMQDGFNPKGSSLLSLSCAYLAKDGSRTEQLNTANAIIAAHICMIDLPRPDLHSRKECEDALYNYFANCAEKNVRPSFSGMCLSLGITRKQLIQLCETGQVTIHGTPNAIAVPNDVWQFMVSLRNNYAAMLESFLETNLIHPTAGVFLLKNNCGYQDEVTHNYNVTNTKVDLSAFAEKYAKELEGDLGEKT